MKSSTAESLRKIDRSYSAHESRYVERQLFETAQRGETTEAPLHLDKAQRNKWRELLNASLIGGYIKTHAGLMFLTALGMRRLEIMRREGYGKARKASGNARGAQ